MIQEQRRMEEELAEKQLKIQFGFLKMSSISLMDGGSLSKANKEPFLNINSKKN